MSANEGKREHEDINQGKKTSPRNNCKRPGLNVYNSKTTPLQHISPLAEGRRGSGRRSSSLPFTAVSWRIPRTRQVVFDQELEHAWARACDRGRQWPPNRLCGEMPFVRVKGGVLCEFFLSSLPVLIGNLVPKGGSPAWEPLLLEEGKRPPPPRFQPY